MTLVTLEIVIFNAESPRGRVLIYKCQRAIVSKVAGLDNKALTKSVRALFRLYERSTVKRVQGGVYVVGLSSVL